MRSIDDYDDEAKLGHEKITTGVRFNFKTISWLLDRMIEETAEYDENYPKKDIMNLWIGNMIAFFILFAASYTILMIVTLPFIFFYFMSLSKIFKAWKRFHYKMGYLWTITIIALIVDVAAAILVQWKFLW